MAATSPAGRPRSASLPSAALLADLVGAGVLVAASTPAAHALRADERRFVAGAVDARRRQFATARAGARALLARLGAPTVGLPIGDDGAPCWPPGFTGSIAHTEDVCLVAVTRTSTAARIGVDVEVVDAVQCEVWDLILTPDERASAAAHALPPRMAAALFCAKEAAYKCWAFRLQHPFDPLRLTIEIDAAGDAFAVRDAAARLLPIVGRLAHHRGHVLAAARLPPAADAPRW